MVIVRAVIGGVKPHRLCALSYLNFLKSKLCFKIVSVSCMEVSGISVSEAETELGSVGTKDSVERSWQSHWVGQKYGTRRRR